MTDVGPTPHDRPAGATRSSARLAAAVLALLVATPLVATVWTRASAQVRMPKTGRVDLENVSYSGRDWGAALTGLEVKRTTEQAGGGDEVTSIWTFHYTNSDREPHYVALTVRCLDSQRRELSNFRVVVTLSADRPGGAKLEQTVRMSEGAWSRALQVRVVADFLSGPTG